MRVCGSHNWKIDILQAFIAAVCVFAPAATVGTIDMLQGLVSSQSKLAEAARFCCCNVLVCGSSQQLERLAEAARFCRCSVRVAWSRQLPQLESLTEAARFCHCKVHVCDSFKTQICGQLQSCCMPQPAFLPKAVFALTIKAASFIN